MPDEVIRNIVQIVRYTRGAPGVLLGAGPRAAVHLLNAVKAHARLAGRNKASLDDVAEMASFVLCHRLIVSGVSTRDVVAAAVAAGR